MNSKGFTLVEVLAVIVIVSLVLLVVGHEFGSTLSATKNDSYKVMKNNIIDAAKDYVNECNSNIISCNLEWSNNNTTFRASVLKNNGYYDNFISPIDGKDLSDCLILNVISNNGVIDIDIEDKCY